MQKKNAPKQTEVVYGVHPIRELLKAGNRKLMTLYTTQPEPKAWGQIKKYLKPYTNIKYVKRDALARLAGTADHQGLVGLATPFVFRKKFFEHTKQPFLLMLDGIQDPRNLGAIIRSAYCTGVDGVILTHKKCAPLNAVALKSSAGLAEHMPIIKLPSAEQAAKKCKEEGYGLYVAALGGKDATAVSYKGPLCVVIGSEDRGASREVINAGQAIMLPQRTPDISYNASVAAGIMLFLVKNKAAF